MLDQVCGGFYIEGGRITTIRIRHFVLEFLGDSCNLVSELSKVEKDVKTNNLYQKGGEFPIPQVGIYSYIICVYTYSFTWLYTAVRNYAQLCVAMCNYV